jgi:DNA-binding transcriptional regulator LsrR (DeoR family)
MDNQPVISHAAPSAGAPAMPAKGQIDRSILIAAVAFESSCGKIQKEISDALGISQSAVSKLVGEAEHARWLGAPRFKIVNKDIWTHTREYFYSTEHIRHLLHKKFGKPGERLRRISLLHTGKRGPSDTGAATTFSNLLGGASSVGVTWGHTISRVVDALYLQKATAQDRDRPRKITFVPLCGEPLSEGDPGSYSSSVLAQRLTDIFNKGRVAAPSIAGVPAFIPLKVGRLKEIAPILHLNSLVRGYASIFGTPVVARAPAPLAQNLDAILTSVGRVDRDRRGIFLTERIQVGDISEAQLMRSVAGDIGGVIIPNSDISDEDSKRIAEMNKNWTGANLEHLGNCAKASHSAASARKRPGVVLLALGAHRMKVVLRCIELGLVNELVIDKALAHQIEKELKSE